MALRHIRPALANIVDQKIRKRFEIVARGGERSCCAEVEAEISKKVEIKDDALDERQNPKMSWLED